MKKCFLPIILAASPALAGGADDSCCGERAAAAATAAAGSYTAPGKAKGSTETGTGDVGTVPDYNPSNPEPVIEPAPAQFKAYPDEGLYWIQANGAMPVKYELARDEMYVGTRTNKDPQYINDPGSYPALLDLAQSTAFLSGQKVYLVAYPQNAPRVLANKRLVTNHVFAMVEPGVSDIDAGIAAGAVQGDHYDFAPEYVVYHFKDGVAALRGAEILAEREGVTYVEPCLARWCEGRAAAPSDKFFMVNATPSYPNPIKYPYPPPNTAKTVHQWYLENSGLNGEFPYTFRAGPQVPVPPATVPWALTPVRADIRARNAWDVSRGVSATVAIVDQGFEKRTTSTPSNEQTVTHADLINTIDLFTGNHWDFIDDTEDPSPPKASLGFANHGTAVASLATAEQNNSSGTPAKVSGDPANIVGGSARELTGVAPLATTYGLRIIEGFVEELELAQAVNWAGKTAMALNTKVDVRHLPDGSVYNDVKLLGQPPIYDVASHAWGPNTSGPAPIYWGRFFMQACRYVLTKKRKNVNGMGPILVASGFNDGDLHGDQNLGEFLSSGMPLVVGSVTDAGWRVGYSSRGANLAFVTPSAGTFAGIPDEILPNTEPRICPTTACPIPLPVPTYIEYPDNPFAGVPVTLAPNPVPVTLKFIGDIPQRRAGQQVVTLANLQKYQIDFEGTSASVGLTTGVAALMVDTNKTLDWQEVQEIMMRTAEANQAPPWWDAYVPPLDVERDWQRSNNYHPVTHKYGYGILNAERALLWARAWRVRADLTPTILNTPGNSSSRYVADGNSEEGTQPFRYQDKVLGYMTIAHRARTGVGQPISNNKVFQLGAPPRNFRVEQVLVRVHAPAVKRGPVGIRLIAPPDGPGKPTIISHLHTPKIEDTGTGFVHYRFSTMRHWGTQYSTYNVGKPWLLQFWGAGVNDKISNDHGINITYWGSTTTQPNNLPPTLAGTVQTWRLKRGVALTRPRTLNVYRQLATPATPLQWTDGKFLKIWFGGELANFDPEKDNADDYPEDFPGFPDSPRRTRSPNVIKPNPSPIPDFLFPPPLNQGFPGRVPLPDPVYRVRADGISIKISQNGAVIGPAAGQTMTLSWNAKSVTFTASDTPTTTVEVPTATAGDNLLTYTRRFAIALASNPTINNDFVVVDETADATGDYIRLMYQPILNPGESGVVSIVEVMANVAGTPTNRSIFGRYQNGLPFDMTFNVRDGSFSGTPTVNGDYEVTVYATNLFDWAPAPLLPRLTPPIGYDNAPPELITPGQPLTVNIRVDDAAWSWQAFRLNYFTGVELADESISGPNADADGDGISNLYEYVAGSDPRFLDLLDPSVFIVPYGVETADGILNLFWTVDTTATEGTMKLQMSSDLENWTDLPNPEPEVFGVLDSFTFTATGIIGEKRFYRLKPELIVAP